MKNHQPVFNRLLLAIVSSMVLALQGITDASAKDTDLYLMAPSVSRDDAPNVLFIFDNSGSMSATVYSRPAYDPTIDYCTADLDAVPAIVAAGIVNANGGKPSNCATISGRIFWSYGSPPATTSSRWFASSKNHCENSKSVLASAGWYGGVKTPGFKSSGTSTGWRALGTLSNGDLTYVDCQIDGLNADGYPRAGATTVATAYTPTQASEFVWNNFNTNAYAKLYSANYLNYRNNPNLITGASTRLQAAKDAVINLINANRSFRFGLMAFNYNGTSEPAGTGRHAGRVIFKLDTMDDARRTAMTSTVNSLGADTWTPLAETLWEARTYFGGLAVDYGDNDPTATPARDTTAQSGSNYISPFKYGCQKAYIVYVTDGDPTNDGDANTKIRTQIGAASCDGTSCLDDLSGWMRNTDVYTGLPGNQTVITYTIGFGDSISGAGLGLLEQTASKGGGKYYTALDADALSSALQGALTDILQVNTSFVAPSLSVNAFNRLYNRDDVFFALFKPNSSVNWDGNIKKFKLCNKAESTAIPPKCTFGDIVYQDGTNLISAIDANSKIKSTAISYWGTTADGAEITKGGAGAQITTPRTLYTYRGSYSGLSASIPATATSTPPLFTVDTTGTNALRSAAVADPTILGLSATATSADVDKLINWMRGQDAYDTRLDDTTAVPPDTGHTGNTTEARTWNFADPLHSRPVAITFGAVTTLGVADPNNPIIKLFVGTNDGMLRIVNNSTGVEEWAFIPQELLASQYGLSQDNDGEHLSGLDDTPTFWTRDINNDGIIDPSAGDRIYMYIGMRRGGRNIYAFDVTPATTMTSQSDTLTPKLIWVIQGGSGNFARLGQTWSRPQIARVNWKCTGSVCNDNDTSTDDGVSRVVLLFGGGYDINQDNSITPGADSMGNAIYMVDPFTGARLWWASNTTSSDIDRAQLELTNMRYGIPSELALTDTNGDKYIDRIYVGDTGGQLWRIDFGGQLDSTGGATGYVFADVGCDGGVRSSDCSATSNQNRRKFFYAPDVAAVSDPTYSVNSRYDLVTIASGNREDPLDLLTTNQVPTQEAVHNRIYAFREYNTKYGTPAATPTLITDNTSGGNLYDATANNLGTLTGAALATEIATFRARMGFFINLKETTAITLPNGLTTTWVGEKSLARTSIFAGVLYATTFTPANDAAALTSCSASEGTARVYGVNALTGSPVFDFDGDGTLDRSFKAGGGIPSGVVIVLREGGATGLVGTSGGAAGTRVRQPGEKNKSFWYNQ
jgi:type IV pilus assembly protein PilY1